MNWSRLKKQKISTVSFRVKPSHFDYLKTIGQGSFGKVYMVRYHGDGKLYAMKVLGKVRMGVGGG